MTMACRQVLSRAAAMEDEECAREAWVALSKLLRRTFLRLWMGPILSAFAATFRAHLQHSHVLKAAMWAVAPAVSSAVKESPSKRSASSQDGTLKIVTAIALHWFGRCPDIAVAATCILRELCVGDSVIGREAAVAHGLVPMFRAFDDLVARCPAGAHAHHDASIGNCPLLTVSPISLDNCLWMCGKLRTCAAAIEAASVVRVARHTLEFVSHCRLAAHSREWEQHASQVSLSSWYVQGVCGL